MMGMLIVPPGEPEDSGPHRARARRAVWCVAAGVVLGAAAMAGGASGAVSAAQAIAVGIPAVLLILGGLIVIFMPGLATIHRIGVQAGLWAGSLRRWRSEFRERGGK
jgi:hypothetical protein